MFAIRVLKDGQVKYVNETSIFSTDALVDCPSKAKTFADGNPKTNHQLARMLDVLNWPAKEMRARSGITVDDYPEIVEFKVEVTIQNSTRYMGFQR